MRNGSRIAAASLLAVSTSVAAAAAAAAAPRQPPFRSGVEIVQLFVTVQDDRGQPVRGLEPEDFELREEGRRQAIAAFDEVDLPAAPPAPSHATPSDVFTNAGASGRRTFVLVLDDLHVRPDLSPRVREQARLFIDRFASDSDLVMVVPTGGDAEMFQELTTDRSRLRLAVDRFIGRRQPQAPRSLDEEIHDARATLQIIGNVGRHLTTADRRVAMVVFTQGFLFHAIGGHGVPRPTATLTQAFRDAVDRLAAANVSVYLVDPAGLAPERPERFDAIRALADETGGFALPARNDFDEVFRRIVEAASSYYVLGYVPGPGRPRRDVDVRVPGRDVRIRVRRRVVTGDTDEEVRRAGSLDVSPGLERALTSPVPLDGLELRLQVIPFRGPDGPIAVFVVETEPEDTPPSGDASRQDRLELALRLFDARGDELAGQSAAAERPPSGLVRWIWSAPLKPGRYFVRAAAASVATGLAGSVLGEYEIPRVDPKRLEMSGIVIGDRGTPEPVTLVGGRGAAVPGGALSPTALRRFARGAVLPALVEIYPSTRNRADIVVTAEVRADGGEPLLAQERRIAGAGGQGSGARGQGSGARGQGAGVGVTFDIPTANLEPGHYVLRVTASLAGGERNQGVERLAVIEIVGP